MNVLMEESPPRPAETSVLSHGLRPQNIRGGYLLGLLIALGIHAALAVFWPKWRGVEKAAEFDVEAGDASVEVSLVAVPPAKESTPQEPLPDPTPPPPPPPEPKPEPPPPPPEKVPEMIIPEPTPPPPPVPERKPEIAPKEHVPKQKPHPASPHAVGDGSSKIPGYDAITAKAASGAVSSKPAYLRNPHPAYPEEARAAKQQGVVSLRVSVDVSGRVVAVRITQSSGFPILDERARSTVAEKWSFKPATSDGVPIASEIAVPIRFTLEH